MRRCKPHHLDVAQSLTFKPTARLDTIEIAADVELQQHRWMIRRTASGLELDPAKSKLRQIEFINKNVNDANGIALANPAFQAFGKQRALCAINSINKALHPNP